MRRSLPFFVLAFVLLSLTACKKTTRLEGRWRGARVEGQAQALRAVYPQVTQYATDLEIVVHNNLITMEMPPNRTTRTAEFTVQKDQPSELQIVVTGGEAETFTFERDNTMRWLVAEGTYIVFQRQKQ